jgi:hypothetical protein
LRTDLNIQNAAQRDEIKRLRTEAPIRKKRDVVVWYPRRAWAHVVKIANAVLAAKEHDPLRSASVAYTMLRLALELDPDLCALLRWNWIIGRFWHEPRGECFFLEGWVVTDRPGRAAIRILSNRLGAKTLEWNGANQMAKKPEPPLKLVTATDTTWAEPPRNLDNRGRSLWDRIMREYDIRDAGGLELLLLACEGIDRIWVLR